MNKLEEELLFKKVKNKPFFNDLNKVNYSDKPDVIAYSKSKKIGIEITECFQDDTRKGSKLRETRSFKNKIGNSLTDRLKDIRPCFHLSIDINITTSQNKYDLLIDKTVKIIKEKIKDRRNNKPKYISSFELQELGFEKISMFFSNDIDNSYFGESDYGFLPNFTDYNLNLILNKKEKLIVNYINCDEYWLLIREGDMIPGSFGDVKINKVNSIFEKIFMYRISQDKLIQLK